ncbi:hypothetical protein PCH_Pc12g12170 [Penicillium rubens Wisconsin 54-1255]|uniref:Uncharacterized protein n=1 Tax=Penicillium rubens (strain ATCC 28089 / DSM 1075 / NRRL 1951 / Wisconsin 54-1255) TaxID=500485 RepID=B6GYC2_PENRW|nr:hypothetical protein PCH_Pc12g12170 [Penicillium rubens Wisconsin 54-1255]
MAMKSQIEYWSRLVAGQSYLLALTLKVAVYLAGNVEYSQDRTQGSQLWGPSRNGLCGEVLGEGTAQVWMPHETWAYPINPDPSCTSHGPAQTRESTAPPCGCTWATLRVSQRMGNNKLPSAVHLPTPNLPDNCLDNDDLPCGNCQDRSPMQMTGFCWSRVIIVFTWTIEGKVGSKSGA